MTASRVALALVLVGSAAETGGAEPCAPRAELGGGAEAVAKVAAELERLGVDARTDATTSGRGDATPQPRTSCPVVVAAVELDRSGGIAVAVRDGSQRSEGRVVSDASVAAAWIDSWLRDDFTTVDEPPAPPLLAPPSTVDVPPLAAPPVLDLFSDRFSLAASFIEAWSDDSTSWSGVAASVCVRVDGLCFGARVGFAKQTVSADLTAAAKTDLTLLATASYPHQLGRMSIAPELGLGVGRLATARIDGCKMDPVVDPNCDPMDPSCGNSKPPVCTNPGTVYVGDGLSEATYTPRMSAALRIAIPIFDHVWLDGLAAATAAPFGHRDEYGVQPDGTTMPNANGVAGFPLPGDPLLGLQLGVGLRVGAP